MTIGVGGMDVPVNVDEAGLRYALGETKTEDEGEGEGEAEDDAPGLAGELPAEAGTVATAPVPACGWR